MLSTPTLCSWDPGRWGEAESHNSVSAIDTHLPGRNRRSGQTGAVWAADQAQGTWHQSGQRKLEGEQVLEEAFVTSGLGLSLEGPQPQEEI